MFSHYFFLDFSRIEYLALFLRAGFQGIVHRLIGYGRYCFVNRIFSTEAPNCQTRFTFQSEIRVESIQSCALTFSRKRRSSFHGSAIQSSGRRKSSF